MQWNSEKLAKLTTKIGSGSTPRGGKDAYHESGVPLIRSLNVHFDGFRYDGLAYLDDEQAHALRSVEVRGGDVLLNITGASIGRVTVAPQSMDGARVNQHVCIIRSVDALDPSFLRWYLASPHAQHLILNVQSGATRQALTKEKILDFEIPVPPLAQQRRIVAEIEKQCSRLDEAVTNLKRVKANLQRYKAAVLKAAVEGRLVETEAELARREGRSYETGAQLLQRILETRRSQWKGKGKYKEPAVPDTTDLPELPEAWVWASVDQLAESEPNSITDGPFGSNLKTEHYQDSGPRVIRLQNIKDGEFADEHAHISPAHFERLRKHEIHAGDLVIASLGDNPPRACIIPPFVGPAIVKADCIRFKPHRALTPAYLNAALNCQPTRQRVKMVLHGVGRPRLSLCEIRAIALPIPPESEQHRIVAEVERQFSIAAVFGKLICASQARATRLQNAVLADQFIHKSGGSTCQQ